jgi:hypothetical protein
MIEIIVEMIWPPRYGLDEKAVEAVRGWTFRPAMKDGRSVKFPATVKSTFKLVGGHYQAADTSSIQGSLRFVH